MKTHATKKRTQGAAAAFGIATCLVFATHATAAITADEANDVCSSSADPCVVSQTVNIVDGSTLDFGTRELQLKNGGQLNFGSGSATVIAGELVGTGSATKPGVKLASGSSGGDAEIRVWSRCSLDASLVCSTTADCTSQNAGTCSLGSGDINFDRKIEGSSQNPGRLSIEATGDITLERAVNIKGSNSSADGGELEITSRSGSIYILGSVNVAGGGDSQGGEVLLDAQLDIEISEKIEATGGRGDGGVIEILAQRDIEITDDVLADSVNGDGFGGEILISAGADVLLAGGTSGNRTLISSDGSSDTSASVGGDGGSVEVLADGALTILQFARIQADGASPDGFGGDIAVESEGNALIAGEIRARRNGSNGAGGGIDIACDGIIDLRPTSTVDATGGGGLIAIAAASNLIVDGAVDVFSNTGVGGMVELSSDATLTVAGDITSGGGLSAVAGTGTSLLACDIVMEGTATIDSDGSSFGRNTLSGRETILLMSGAQLSAAEENELVYRSATPTVDGTVTPTETLKQRPQLSPCS